MNLHVEKFEKKIDSLPHNLTATELSALFAGVHDIFEGIEKIKHCIDEMYKTDDVTEIGEILSDIQFEYVNHIKTHIDHMEYPFQKLANQF